MYSPMFLKITKLDEIKTGPGNPGHMVTITRKKERKEGKKKKKMSKKERKKKRKEDARRKKKGLLFALWSIDKK